MGCGNEEHPEDCLCDVTPLGVDIDPDAVAGMWMGKRIAEIHGLNLTDPTEILSWLEAVTYGHDRFMEMSNHVADPTGEYSKPLIRRGTPLEWWRDIRQAVTHFVRYYPVTSVLPVLERLGISAREFCEAMTVMQSRRYLDEAEYAEFEADMLGHRPVYADIARKWELSPSTVYKFRDLYSPMVIRLHGDGGDPRIALKEFHDLIRQGVDNKTIIETIDAKYGIRYNPKSIINYRRIHGIPSPYKKRKP